MTLFVGNFFCWCILGNFLCDSKSREDMEAMRMENAVLKKEVEKANEELRFHRTMVDNKLRSQDKIINLISRTTHHFTLLNPNKPLSWICIIV